MPTSPVLNFPRSWSQANRAALARDVARLPPSGVQGVVVAIYGREILGLKRTWHASSIDFSSLNELSCDRVAEHLATRARPPPRRWGPREAPDRGREPAVTSSAKEIIEISDDEDAAKVDGEVAGTPRKRRDDEVAGADREVAPLSFAERWKAEDDAALACFAAPESPSVVPNDADFEALAATDHGSGSERKRAAPPAPPAPPKRVRKQLPRALANIADHLPSGAGYPAPAPVAGADARRDDAPARAEVVDDSAAEDDDEFAIPTRGKGANISTRGVHAEAAATSFEEAVEMSEFARAASEALAREEAAARAPRAAPARPVYGCTRCRDRGCDRCRAHDAPAAAAAARDDAPAPAPAPPAPAPPAPAPSAVRPVPADWPLVGPYDTRTLITYRERLRGSHVAVPGRFWPDADDGWKDLLFKCEIHGSTRGFKFKGPGAARRNGLGQGMAFQIYDVKYEYEYVCAATDLAAFIADHGINPPDAKFA